MGTRQLFCVACGIRLPDSGRFCPECGAPISAPVSAPDPAPPAPQPIGTPPPRPTSPSPGAAPGSPQIGWGLPPAQAGSRPDGPPRPGRPTSRGTSRWTLYTIGGLAACLVVGAGAWGVTALLGDGDRSGDTTSRGRTLHRAITELPERQWTWTYDSDEGGAGVVVLDDGVLVSRWDQGVTRLDADGEEKWSASLEYDGGIQASSDDDLFLAHASEEGNGLAVAKTSDGSELWHSELSLHSEIGDSLVLLDYDGDGEDGASDYSVVNRRTGEERWTTRADQIVNSGGQLFAVDGGAVSRLDPSDGEEIWSSTVDWDEDTWPGVEASETMVTIDLDDQAIALDLDDGTELWTVEVGGDDDSVSTTLFGRDTFAVERYAYDDEYEEGRSEYSLYDRDGEAQELSLGTDSTAGFETFEAGGELYALQDNGNLYDAEAVELVGRYDGILTPTDNGLYSQTDSGIRFFEYGASSSQWHLDGIGSQGYLEAGDQTFVIDNYEGRLSYYE